MKRISHYIRFSASALLLVFVLALSAKSLHVIWGDCQHHVELSTNVADLGEAEIDLSTNNFEDCTLCKFTFSQVLVADAPSFEILRAEYGQKLPIPYHHIRTQSEVANQSLRGPPSC